MEQYDRIKIIKLKLYMYILTTQIQFIQKQLKTLNLESIFNRANSQRVEVFKV